MHQSPDNKLLAVFLFFSNAYTARMRNVRTVAGDKYVYWGGQHPKRAYKSTAGHKHPKRNVLALERDSEKRILYSYDTPGLLEVRGRVSNSINSWIFVLGASCILTTLRDLLNDCSFVFCFVRIFYFLNSPNHCVEATVREHSLCY